MNSLPKDPVMLLSSVNMKLRDMYSSLDELCDALLEDRKEIEDKLNLIGYHYNEELNQFK